MNSRRLFVIIIAIGSATLGAGVAVVAHLQSLSASLSSQRPPQSVAATSAPSASPLPSALPPSSPSPRVTAAVAPAPPDSPLFLPPSSTAAIESPTDLEQLRIQLRRAIRERNAVLLRSLLQASSVREAMSTLTPTEQVNFENLDASAWKILETAISYRCQQQMVRAGQDSSSCFEP